MGEVYGAPRPYNHQVELKGLYSPDHICGTKADFAEGQIGPAIPPTEYDALHIPLCCNIQIFRGLVRVGFTILSTVRLYARHVSSVRTGYTIVSRVGLIRSVRTSVPTRYTIISDVETFGIISALVPVGFTILSSVTLSPDVASSCETAYPLGQDVQPPFDLFAGRAWWFRLGGLKAPLPYALHLLGTLLVPGNTQLLTGDNCGALINQPYTIYTSDCWGWYQLDYFSTYVVVTPTETITAGTAFLWNRTLCSGQPPAP